MSDKQHGKNVIILIEGKSERIAFELALPDLFDRIASDYQIHFATIFEDDIEKCGDITSKKGITPQTIEGCICKLFIRKVLEETKIYVRDISEVIHIIDLDGAYIPEDHILKGINPTGENKPFYDSEKIITDNVDAIIDRNKQKRNNIDKLLSLPDGKITVWQNPDNPASKQRKIPYSLYYFSSNLDHFIHNEANITSIYSKVHLAETFRNGFVDNTDGFTDYFINDPDSAVDKSYLQSWANIQEAGLNSLSRHTNIDILLKRLIEEAKKQ